MAGLSFVFHVFGPSKGSPVSLRVGTRNLFSCFRRRGAVSVLLSTRLLPSELSSAYVDMETLLRETKVLGS